MIQNNNNIYLPIYLSIYLSIHPIYLPIYLSIYLSIYLIYLPILSIYLSILSIYTVHINNMCTCMYSILEHDVVEISKHLPWPPFRIIEHESCSSPAASHSQHAYCSCCHWPADNMSGGTKKTVLLVSCCRGLSILGYPNSRKAAQIIHLPTPRLSNICIHRLPNHNIMCYKN